jgi:hypothetical protein
MKLKWLSRLPAVCGAIYVILALSEGDDGDRSPTIASSGEEIARYAAAHQLTQGRYLAAVASLFALLVFAAVLHAALRRAAPRPAIASVVVLAAGTLAVAVKLSSFPALYALYSSTTQVDGSVARSLWMQGEFAFVLMMLAQALMLGAAAASGLIHGGIPRWLAATAGVIAVALPVGVVVAGNSTNFLAELVWLAWVLAASVTLTVRPPDPSPDRARVRPTEPAAAEA